MRVLIVTDIFGVTASVLSLANALMAERAHVEVVDPYDGKEKSFSHEQSAYDAFLANCCLTRRIFSCARREILLVL